MSWFKLPRASHTVAFASITAFGIQVIFALLMLRFFTPEEVGEYSVLSQIGFFWTTLALAQAPISLLANKHLPAAISAEQAWRSSVLRALGLFPIAALAVWFSQLHLWPSMVWVALLAFFQLTWMLAQSFTLKAGSSLQQFGVRVIPPLIAAFTALCGALMGQMFVQLGLNNSTLVLSAVLGYGVGAVWLAPALLAHRQVFDSEKSLTYPINSTVDEVKRSDSRSASLRMSHTLVDALLATAIVLVWQRLYGAQETGWMNALLRVFGFIPALVHMAWSQVMLARADFTYNASRQQALMIGAMGALMVVLLGACCAFFIHDEWLDPKWDGLWAYLLPLVVWQGTACLTAALSYRPFQTNDASLYSWLCMALAGLQAVVLFYPVFFEPIAVWTHLSAFALVSAIGLLGLCAWLFTLESSPQA